MRFIALVFTALIVLQAGAQRPYVDAELGALATKLWDSDPNRLRVGRDLILNWQGALTNQDDARDLAPAPLCTIKTNKLKSSPVYNC
uniref:XendoU domain-containing protein n=1 Tax=Mesocestoides corti TaxID=53468 RepID=A0A5K3F6U9_MESCO